MLTRASADHAGAAVCDAVRAQTFAACDGELSAAASAVIDAHLLSCASCRTRFEADATFHGVVRAAVALETAPSTLRDRIRHSLTTRSIVNAPA